MQKIYIYKNKDIFKLNSYLELVEIVVNLYS